MRILMPNLERLIKKYRLAPKEKTLPIILLPGIVTVNILQLLI